MSRPWFAAAMAAFVLVLATPTWGQQSSRSTRPYRGLFNGDSGAAPTSGQQFGISAMLVSGYDDNLRAEARGGGNQLGSAAREGVGGSLSHATGMASYVLSADALTFSASAGSSARYYPSLEDKYVAFVMATSSVAYSTPLWTRLTLGFAGTISYRPYFFDAARLFADDGTAPPPVSDSDLPYLAESYLLHSERLSLTYRLGPRTSVHGLAGYAGARAGNERTFGRLTWGGRLSHVVSPGLSVHAGYRRRDMFRRDGSIIPLHVVDVGADYSRALSFSRRTTLSFSTGSAATRRDEELRFRVTGDVQLTHEIGRTWTAAAAYHRRMLESEVFNDLAIADGITVGVGGLASRRLKLDFTAHGVLGRTGVRRNAPGFDGVRAAATAGYALNRFVNFTAMYAYYHHKFDDATQLAIDLPPTLSRQSVRIGVMLWMPVYKSARRTDASG